MARHCAGTGRYHEWEHTEDERHRGHQDRTQPQPRGGGYSFVDAQSARLSLDREFDGQDRVPRGEADIRDQADLEIDV